MNAKEACIGMKLMTTRVGGLNGVRNVRFLQELEPSVHAVLRGRGKGEETLMMGYGKECRKRHKEAEEYCINNERRPCGAIICNEIEGGDMVSKEEIVVADSARGKSTSTGTRLRK